MRQFLHLSLQALDALEAGNTDGAADLWRTIRDLYPQEPSGFYAGAFVARQRGETLEAETLLRHAVDHFPYHVDAAIDFAICSYHRKDWAELAERWARIPEACRLPNYFVLTVPVWLYWIEAENQEKAEASFQLLLSEPIGSGDRALPNVVSEILMKESDRPLFNRVTDWMRDYFQRHAPSTPTAQLVVLVFQFPTPDRNILLWQWAKEPDFRRLAAIFQNIQLPDGAYLFQDRSNFLVLQGIARLLLSNGTVDRLSDTQCYNFALLLSTGDRRLFGEFLGAASRDGAASDDLSQPLGVLSQVWRELQARPPAAPALLPRQKLRIALCISGQLRGYEEAYQSWDKFGFHGHEFDPYVHCWTVIGRKFPYFHHAERSFSGEFLEAYRQVATAITEAEMHRRYPTFFAYFSSGGNEATPDRLKALYGTDQVVVEDDRAPPFQQLSNFDKMYYKTEACFRMAEQSGKSYDMIIRIRPDKPVLSCDPVDWAEILNDLRKNRRIYTGDQISVHWWIGYMVDDQFALGDAECMGKYSKTYSFTQQAVSRNCYGFPKGYGGHVNFAHAAFLQGIDVAQMPGLVFAPLQDPHRIPADILLDLLLTDLRGRLPDLYDQRLIEACRQDRGQLSAS